MSPIPLPGKVEHREGEPAYALLIRALEHNGTRRIYTAVNRFTGRKGQTVSVLDPSEIARICKADPAAVAYATPVLGSATATLMGQALSAEHVVVTRRRWCPACLSESLYHRVWWDLLPVTTCPTHGIRLATSCGCKGRPLLWRSQPIGSCGKGHVLSQVACEEAHPDNIALDAYVVGRLRGMAGPQLLDETSLGDVLTVAERLGKASIDEAARIYSLRKSHPTGRLHAEGFRVLNKLPEAFEEILDRLRADQVTRRGGYGVRKAFGEFYKFVRSLPDHPVGALLKKILADHARRNVTLVTGTRLDGHTRHVNEGLNVRDAADALGLTLPRLADALERLGVPLTDRGVRSEISADHYEMVRARLAGARSLGQVSAELGLTQIETAGLGTAGILDVLVVGEGTRKWMFPADAASTFLDRLRSRVAAARGRRPSGYMPLPRAARSVRASVAEVVPLVLGGNVDIRAGRKRGHALSSFRVDPRELVLHLGERGESGVTLATAAEELGLTLTGMELVLKGGLMRTSVNDGLVCITNSEISRFRDEWATMRELKAALGVRSIIPLTEALAVAGVDPVVRGSRLCDLIYPRREALHVCRTASATLSGQPRRGWNRNSLAAAMQTSPKMVRQMVQARLIGLRAGCAFGDIPEAEVERIMQSYVTGGKLAEAFGLSNGKAALSALSKMGVDPVCGRPAFDAYLYARREAEEALGRWAKAAEAADADRDDSGSTLSLKEVADSLPTGINMVHQLVANGVLAVRQRRPRFEVLISELEQFRLRYVLSNEVARLAGLPRQHGLGRIVTHRLLKAGIQPVCAPPTFVNYVFRRDEALAALALVKS